MFKLQLENLNFIQLSSEHFMRYMKSAMNNQINSLDMLLSATKNVSTNPTHILVARIGASSRVSHYQCFYRNIKSRKLRDLN